MRKKQLGFNLVELMISLVVGVVLLQGVLLTFTSMRATTEETSSYGELQENGRFALTLITEDLIRQGFWGGIPDHLSTGLLSEVPPLDNNDCFGSGINNRSFPLDIGHFRAIWGETADASDALNCIDDAKIGSDVVQIKRVISSTVDGGSVEDDRFYLISNMSSGAIFAGDDAVPNIEYGNIWEYQHHIYYVKEYDYGDDTVPALMLGRLRNEIGSDPIFFDPLIDGIEMIRLTYGVDTDGDGIVNAFIGADQMPNSFWDHESDTAILAVTVYVLARSIEPDLDYENLDSYQLGDLTVDFIDENGAGDNYRRLLMSATVTLHNARMESW